jgi:hypothetical protein
MFADNPDPEVDELEAVECDYCRAIFEHTGVKHCPIHQLPGPMLGAPEQLQLAGGV